MNLLKLIRIAGILDNSDVNGPGIRLVIFGQGCNHHCPGCFNEHTWNLDGGTLVSFDEILNKIKKDPLLEGVTFSGGDPFLQPIQFGMLAEEIKAINKKLNIWCYTGFTYEDLRNIRGDERKDFEYLLSNIDVLVDGRFEKDNQFTSEDLGRLTKEKGLDELFIPYRGSKNQRVIDVHKSLKKNKVQLVKEFQI